MLMALGQFVFMTQTLPYQELGRTTQWRHPSQSRIGERPARQFLGVGDDTITLTGTLLPEFTGGRLSLDELRDMADRGKAWPLVEGTGRIYGFWTIESINERSSTFFYDGLAQKIEFTIVLQHVDDPTPQLIGEVTGASGGAASTETGESEAAYV